jgi:DNA-binding PadR family transcriptional regulator
MATRGRSNPLALAVLSCLWQRPMHPYEIATTLREQGKDGSIKINYGSLYTVVESLLKKKLIEERETVREGRRPERTVYAITDAGKREHDDWLAELISRPTSEFTLFEAALSLIGGLPPDEVVRLLEQRRGLLYMQIKAGESGHQAALDGGLPELFLIEWGYKNALGRAELAFVEDLITRIREHKLDGVDIWAGFHADDAGRKEAEEVIHRRMAEAAERTGQHVAPWLAEERRRREGGGPPDAANT